eukprot:6178102-Pleurochrysis_carterae.AAC.1
MQNCRPAEILLRLSLIRYFAQKPDSKERDHSSSSQPPPTAAEGALTLLARGRKKHTDHPGEHMVRCYPPAFAAYSSQLSIPCHQSLLMHVVAATSPRAHPCRTPIPRAWARAIPVAPTHVKANTCTMQSASTLHYTVYL